MDILTIGISLTYYMIMCAVVIILTGKYWKIFLGVWSILLLLLLIDLQIPGVFVSCLGVITILMPVIISILDKSKNNKKMLYALGGLFIVLLISYLIASNELLESYEKYKITSATSKNVGMGLMSFYILAASAIGIVIYTEISKVFSK
tara:strand:+ start:3920 stop:4363 length:444 start_codon:yes stop_codon:yes gene_type:complete